MKIIKPSYEIMTKINREEILKTLEMAGRTCYKSEDKITEESASKFVKVLIKSGHEAMIEHYSLTMKIICDRGVTHEIVRHRVASYAQESTRYCNYGQDKFGKQITFILPNWFEYGCSTYEDILNGKYEKVFIKDAEAEWIQQMASAESSYIRLLDLGWTPQEARSVLPNSLKTEIIVTMNMRELRHFLRLRSAKVAHPQIREIAIPLLEELKEKLPEIFGDIEVV